MGLAFVAFPKALAALPWANVFSVVFFIALLLLGIDSAFSITEATLASMIAKTGWKRISVLTALSLVGFGVGLIFTCNGGLNWLDLINDFINEGLLGIIFLGLLECLVLGWAFDIGKLRRHANQNSDWQLGGWWIWSIRVVAPVILAILLGWNLYSDLKSEGGFIVDSQGELNGTNIFGIAMLIMVFLGAVILGLWRSAKSVQVKEFDT